MVFKGLIAATASLALMAAPAVAASSTTAAAPAGQVNPASENVDGLEASGNIVIIVLALIAVGLGIWAILDKDDSPASP